MTGSLFALAFLAAPLFCPPDIAHIRWDGVESRVSADDIEIRGTIWDRDRDGKPSAGDVMRIDSARRGGSVIDVSETWVVIKGDFARTLARDLKRSDVRESCERPFEFEGVPTIHDGKALARYFEEIVPSAVAETTEEVPAVEGKLKL